MTDSTLGTDRSVFMARVRTALGRTNTLAPDAPPAFDESIARLASAEDDLADLFEQRAVEVGMIVHRVTNNDLIDAVKKVLAEHRAKRIVLAMANEQDMRRGLAEDGYDMLDLTGDFDPQFGADIGITDTHAALAETGTLICHSDAEHSRGPSLIPELHIAVLQEADIVPDMIDHWNNMQGLTCADLPSSIVMITGPSKTADIEGFLVTGVHGPKKVHVMLVSYG